MCLRITSFRICRCLYGLSVPDLRFWNFDHKLSLHSALNTASDMSPAPMKQVATKSRRGFNVNTYFSGH